MAIAMFSIFHAGGAYPDGWLESDWRPESMVILGVFALIVAYLFWTGPRNRTATGEQIRPVSGARQAASPRIFGTSLAADQEGAGLKMWVLAGFVYLAEITGGYFQWAGNEEAKENRQRRSVVADAATPLDSSTSRLS